MLQIFGTPSLLAPGTKRCPSLYLKPYLLTLGSFSKEALLGIAEGDMFILIEKHICPPYPSAILAFRPSITHPTPSVFHADQGGMPQWFCMCQFGNLKKRFQKVLKN